MNISIFLSYPQPYLKKQREFIKRIKKNWRIEDLLQEHWE